MSRTACTSTSSPAFAAAYDAAPRDPFARRFGLDLPRELREESRHMSWAAFLATYRPTTGVRLGRWEATRLPAGRRRYSMTLAHAGRLRRHAIDASGPAQAMSQALAETGLRVEILSFHQLPAGDATATFLKTHCEGRTRWSAGFGATADEATMRAMIAAANLLHTSE